MEIRVADIETLKCMFLYCDYNPDRKEWNIFELSAYKDDSKELYNYLTNRAFDYMVSFNGVGFDAQVLQYFIDNYSKWIKRGVDSDEMIELLYQSAQDVISLTSSDQFPPYREEHLIPQIDLFKIAHYDNEARRCSLKWLEFMMDVENIEEMPYSHSVEKLNPGQIKEIRNYCKNDIYATYKFYQFLTGNVEHELYKGKNKIQDRLDLIEELGFPKKAMNWSDVKIGDEINKKGYMKVKNIREFKKVYELKSRRKRREFTFGDCIPKYVKFQTEAFQEFYNSVKNVRVYLIEGDHKQEFPFIYNETTYTIAKGGIHSNESNRIVIPEDNQILRDADVGSQYPNAIVKRNLYPSHLGSEWLINYKLQIKRRMEYKAKGKDNPKYKGLSEMFKLALNGGGFGKTNQNSSWQYDPPVTFYCTIGNQFEILMLIEMLELEGIHCISANTDGIVCLFDKALEDKYNETCQKWETIVGNTEMGKLEYTDFKLLVQESINHYWAVKQNGEVKVKGRFDIDVELHKNNTDKISRIERKALREYFLNNIPVADTINAENNIFYFLIGKKATRDYHYEAIGIYDNTVIKYQRIIRYYFAKQGFRLHKVKNETSEATGAQITNLTQKHPAVILNKIEDVDYHLSNIDRTYYINNCLEIIARIQNPKPKKRKKKDCCKEQLSLF